jgi:hypothetical protein
MRLLKKLSRILLGLLRELSDETAYLRHLKAHGLEDSGEAWRRFSNERFRAKFVRPKCC